MKTMEAKEIFNNMRIYAKENYNDTNKAYHISCTSNKLTRIEKMVNKFYEDTKIDYDLGVTDKAEYEKETAMLQIMRNSIKFAEIY